MGIWRGWKTFGDGISSRHIVIMVLTFSLVHRCFHFSLICNHINIQIIRHLVLRGICWVDCTLVIGRFYVKSKSVLILPQIIKNFKKKSTKGLSYLLVSLNLLGDIFKFVYFIIKVRIHLIKESSISVHHLWRCPDSPRFICHLPDLLLSGR